MCEEKDHSAWSYCQITTGTSAVELRNMTMPLFVLDIIPLARDIIKEKKIYLKRMIWHQEFRSNFSVAEEACFSSSFHPCSQPPPAPFYLAVSCITPWLHISESPTINLPSFKSLFKCLLVKPHSVNLEKVPFHMEHPKNGRRVSATGIKLDPALSECFILSVYRQQACRGRNNLFFQVPQNSHYIICFSQVKTTIAFWTLSGISFASMKHLDGVNQIMMWQKYQPQ